MKLSMIGAGSLLCKVSKPLALWEKIKLNQFGQERSYKNSPKILHAISRLTSKTMSEIESWWKEQTLSERGVWKNRPDIKKELLRMQIDEIDSNTTDSPS